MSPIRHPTRRNGARLSKSPRRSGRRAAPGVALQFVHHDLAVQIYEVTFRVRRGLIRAAHQRRTRDRTATEPGDNL
jgi:hypothetical protein